MLQAEYAEVLGGASREVIDEVVVVARGLHPDFPPRPPQLLRVLEQVREQQRARNAARADAAQKKRALSAPAPDPLKAQEGCDWMKAFVARGGNVRPVKRSGVAEAADTRDYYRMATMMALGAIAPAKKLKILGHA